MSETNKNTTSVTSYSWSFNIPDFTKKMNVNISEGSLQSSTVKFPVAGKEKRFYILVWPNGHKDIPNSEAFVTLCLINPPDTWDTPLNTIVKFSVLDNNKRKTQVRQEKHAFVTYEPKNKKTLWISNYISHELLNSKKDSLIPEDTLTIICEVSISGDEMDILGTQTDPLSSLSIDIGSILETEMFSDCIVKCDEKEFKCHKNILSSRSTVFAAMFTHDMEEKNKNIVNITDMDSDTVYDMIVFIYTGKVAEIDDKATGLLAAAEKYDLKELKQMSEESLAKNINKDNVMDLVVLADLYRGGLVRGQAIWFIVNNLKDIVGEDEWKEKLMAYPGIMVDILDTLTKLKL